MKIHFPANDNDALALVAAGKAEIGMYYQQDVIQAVANQGTGIKSIGAIVQSPLNVILSLKDKNITKPEDLVGKTIGYGGTVLSEALVKCMMENVGADASDVNMINVGFELMSSMTTGNVDATIGCLVNHEVPQLEEEGFDVNYFSVSGYGIPNYYEEVFLTNDDLLENEPEVVAGFLRAAKKGFDDFKADPDGCLAILMNNQNEENFPLTQSVEEQSCATLIPLMETEDAAFLTQTDECWQENIDWMLENQLIDKLVELVQAEIPEAMYTNRINDDVRDFAYRLQSQGLNLNTYLQYTGMNMDGLRQSFRPQAERQVKVRLALEKIAGLENIQPTDADLEAEYEKLAKNYELEVDKVKSFIPKEELVKDIAVEKAIQIVRDTAVVTEADEAEEAKAEEAKDAE